MVALGLGAQSLGLWGLEACFLSLSLSLSLSVSPSLSVSLSVSLPTHLSHEAQAERGRDRRL